MTAQQKTVAGLGLALAILIGSEWVSYRNTTALIGSGRSIRHTYRVRDSLQRIWSLLKDAEGGVRRFVITGREGYLAPYRAAARSLDRRIRDLKPLVANNPTREQQLVALAPLIRTRLADLENVITLRTQSGTRAATEALRANDEARLMDAIRAAIDEMRRAESARLQRQEVESRTNTNRTIVGLVVGAVLALSILLLVFHRLTREITERERAQEALKRSEERFRSIIENSSDLVALLNEDQTISYASPSHQRLLGYPPGALVGRRTLDFVHPEDRPLIEDAFARLLQSPNVPQPIEIRFRHRDRSWRILEWHGHNFIHDPAVAAIVVNARDVTGRKRAEEVARQRQAELAHVLRVSTISEMAAGLAHEINQPLSAIVSYAKGCVRRVRTNPVQSPELVDALEEIAAQAVRADQILRRLRNFVSKRAPRRERVNMNELVRGVARLVASETWERGIGVQLDLAVGLPRVAVDSIQIEQVILNLVRNGIEAMPGRNDASPILSIRTSVSRPNLEVAVCDSGEGFIATHSDDVFNPFFTTKPNGLGMGLTISRSIVEAHGGRLWATPNSDHGATFRFTVPLTNADGEDANAS